MTWRGRSGSESGPAVTPVTLVLIVLGAAAVAEIAVLLLSPGDTGPDPLPVDAARWFDPAASAAAASFRDGQRNLFLVGFAVELAALGALALGRPRRARRALDRLGRRPILGAAVAAAGISILLALLALPTGVIGHERSVDVGLSTQGLGSWFADRAKGAAIAALLAAIGGMILIGLQRRLPRFWWVVGTGIVVAYAVVSTWLAPVVLAPIFNDFDELPPGPARSAVLDLAEQSGVEVGHVYVVDASRRSTGVNAYVDGIGSSRRVVLYDNLVDRADQPVLRSVVAHELGHVAHDDLGRGLLFVAIIAPLGMLLVAVAGGALARRGGTRPGLPAAIPAYALLASPSSRSARPRRQPAFAPGRGERRRLRAPSHRRSARFHRASAAACEGQSQRPGPLGGGRRTAPVPPDRGATDRRGACLCEDEGIDPGEPAFPPSR